jgi:hypothetical protein
MAVLSTLVARLTIRMKGMTTADLEDWIKLSAIEHGYVDANSNADIASIPLKAEKAVLAYSKLIGLESKAIETAEDPSMSVKGTSFNLGGSSGNYQKLLEVAQKDYRLEAMRAGLLVLGTATTGSMIRPDGR